MSYELRMRRGESNGEHIKLQAMSAMQLIVDDTRQLD